MKTIPQMLDERAKIEKEVKAQHRRVKLIEAAILVFVAVMIGIVAIQIIGAAVEKAAFDAIDAQDRPVKW